MARAAEYTGDGEAALTLSQEALVRSDRLTPLPRSFSANVEAMAHGRRGDTEACLAAVGRAEEEFAAADPGNETAAWLSFYTPAELAGEAGQALWPLAMRGQHVDAAAQRLRTAADSYSDPHARSRAISQAQLATLQFTIGDPAEAVATGEAAVNGAGSIQSRRLADQLVMVARAAKKHTSAPGSAQLRRRISSALAAV